MVLLMDYVIGGATIWTWVYSLLVIGTGAAAFLVFVYFISQAWHAGSR
jgi:hypothetical protein